MLKQIQHNLLTIPVEGQGLYEFTHDVNGALEKSGLTEGLITLFLRHTSASLLIQENADPSAQADLERWINRLVPEADELYTHVAEGPDDMPAHIKAALTATNLTVPVHNSQLMLGIWQGIFLWEHRHKAGSREVVLTPIGSSDSL